MEENNNDKIEMKVSHLKYNGKMLQHAIPYELWYGQTKDSNTSWKLDAEFLLQNTVEDGYEYGWDAAFLQQ
eukprot:1836677-Ditylum_brightwellii.AAC.1